MELDRTFFLKLGKLAFTHGVKQAAEGGAINQGIARYKPFYPTEHIETMLTRPSGIDQETWDTEYFPERWGKAQALATESNIVRDMRERWMRENEITQPADPVLTPEYEEFLNTVVRPIAKIHSQDAFRQNTKAQAIDMISTAGGSALSNQLSKYIGNIPISNTLLNNKYTRGGLNFGANYGAPIALGTAISAIPGVPNSDYVYDQGLNKSIDALSSFAYASRNLPLAAVAGGVNIAKNYKDSKDREQLLTTYYANAPGAFNDFIREKKLNTALSRAKGNPVQQQKIKDQIKELAESIANRKFHNPVPDDVAPRFMYPGNSGIKPMFGQFKQKNVQPFNPSQISTPEQSPEQTQAPSLKATPPPLPSNPPATQAQTISTPRFNPTTSNTALPKPPTPKVNFPQNLNPQNRNFTI
jgi:hypothetical protein